MVDLGGGEGGPVAFDEGAQVWLRATGAHWGEPEVDQGWGLWPLWLRALYETPFLFSGVLDGFGRVVEANRLSVEGCGLAREDVMGRPFWECGWWNRDPVLAQDVRLWWAEAASTGKPFRVTSPFFLGDGTRRMVDLSLFPLTHGSDAGRRFIVATGLDVTDALSAVSERVQVMVLEAEVLREADRSRVLQLAAAHEAEARVRERLVQLGAVAIDLINAETPANLSRIVFARLVPVLGADSGLVLLGGPGQALRVVAEDDPGSVPLPVFEASSARPEVYVVRTGLPLLLPNPAAGVAFSTELAFGYEQGGPRAAAYVPLNIGERTLGCLSLYWAQEHLVRAEELALIEAFAAQCALSLDRIQASQARERSVKRMATMVESMQRALLLRPPVDSSLEVGARYVPAVREAQVGGDWYDAFTTRTGVTWVSVGDVSGHDEDAAAMMAQLRNLLRGLAADRDEGPAALLRRLDHAIADLDLGAIATTVLIRVDPQDASGAGRHVLWSSAGHPPPLLRSPNGATVILANSPELLLGLDPGTTRSDHAMQLPALASLMLYTDGLIERRDEDIDTGQQRLLTAFSKTAASTSAAICEEILRALLPGPPEDDVALLLLRVTP